MNFTKNTCNKLNEDVLYTRFVARIKLYLHVIYSETSSINKLNLQIKRSYDILF